MENKEHPELDRFIEPLEEIPGKYVIDLPKIESYNAQWYFITSGRGPGKTFSVKGKMVKDICKHLGDLQMFIIYRKENELIRSVDNNADNLLLDIWQKTPFLKNNFTYRKRNNRIIEFAKLKFNSDGYPLEDKDLEWHTAIHTIYLSGSVPRSIAYNKVKYVLFDEFQITEENQNYVKGEYRLVLNLISTIFREREAYVYMLSNTGSILNPYYHGLGFATPEQEVWTKSVQLPSDGAGKGAKIKVAIFNLKIDPKKLRTPNIAGALGNENDYNTDYGETSKFITSRNETSRITMNFTLDNEKYSIYHQRFNDGKTGLLICEGHNKGANVTVSDSFLTGESLTGNALGAKLKRHAKAQTLYFENITVRSQLTNFINAGY